MSVGNQLIAKLATTQSRQDYFKLVEGYFTEEELLLYQFVANFFRRYNNPPSFATLRENGFRPVEANESFEYYLNRIRQRAVFNAIRAKHGDFTDAMRENNSTDALRVLEEMVADARAVRNPEEYTNLVEVSREVVTDYRVAKANPGIQGIPFGWPQIDELTLGNQAGDLNIIVARPGVGKSYLLLWTAISAWMQGYSPLIISMEMIVKQIIQRWISICSRLNTNYIRKGQLSLWGERIMYETIRSFEGAVPVHLVSGNFGKTVEDAWDATRYFEPDILLVDAAYLLGTAKGFRSAQARWEKTTEVMDSLKMLAGTMQIPVIATVQFTKQVKRGTRDLDLSQIAHADAIPQLASIVMGVTPGRSPLVNTTREIHIMKHREGEADKRFNINFNFTPVDFSERVGQDDDSELETTWMI